MGSSTPSGLCVVGGRGLQPLGGVEAADLPGLVSVAHSGAVGLAPRGHFHLYKDRHRVATWSRQ